MRLEVLFNIGIPTVAHPTSAILGKQLHVAQVIMSVNTLPGVPYSTLSNAQHPDGSIGDTFGQQSTTDSSLSFSKTTHLANGLVLEARAPPVQHPYSMENSMSDLPCAAHALDLFLASHMFESEDYLDKGDPKK